MAAKIQTFRLEEAKGREVKSTRGRGVNGAGSPDLNVVQFPIDTGIPEINLRFGFDQVGDGFFTPRHHHNFDQFRYVVYGQMNLAKGMDLQEGECAYFPEGTHYGPLTQQGAVGLLVMQFPGPNGAYRIKDSEKKVAMEELKAAGGFFEDGIYKVHTPDGRKVNKDSYEAVWEHHMGQPISYSAPRYSTPIVMRPKGFRWMRDPHRPGVEVKHLGAFNEYGTSVALWRIAPGAVIASEVLSAPQVRCVVSGATSYEGRELDDKACYYIPEGLPTSPIKSPAGAQLLVITLPMYARATWEKAKAHRQSQPESALVG
jgi:mannose-6-phosphate isomerase-like protein (cupin superfamily)